MENFKNKVKLLKKINTVSTQSNIKKDKSVDYGSGNKRVKYEYASYNSILKTINPLLAKEGLTIFHETSVQDNNTYLLTTYIVDIETGEYVKSEKIYPINANQQVNGSNETYSKRYNVVLLLNLDSDEDDDANLQQVVTSQPQYNAHKIQYITPQQVEEVKGIVGDKLPEVLRFFRVSRVENLTQGAYNAIIKKHSKGQQ